MEILEKLVNFLGGISIIATAIISYMAKIYFERYKRQQEILVRELQAELERSNSSLKSKLDKVNHISRVQFDKEFAIYHEIWSAIFEVRDSVSKLRPVVDHHKVGESAEERKQKRLTSFYDKYNPLVVAIESNRPFYYEDIYLVVCGFRDLCRKEAFEYQHYDDYPYTKEYWESHELNMDEIKSSFEKCSEEIRNRIYSLSVID